MTPLRCGDVYLYDLLPTTPNRNQSPYQNLSAMSEGDTYDIPKTPVHINYDSPRPWSRTSPQSVRAEEAYDVPRPITLLTQQHITPSSSNSSLFTADSLSLYSSNRSSLANMPDYDIPRRHPPSLRALTPSNSLGSHQSNYDIPQAHSQKEIKRELPLELSSAMETLVKLQNEATGAVTK